MSFEHIPKWLLRLCRVALAVLTIIYPLFMCCMTGYGWLLNAEHYGAEFHHYATAVFVGAVFFISANILCFTKKNIAAVISGIIGFLLQIVTIGKAVAIAKENSWGPQTEQGFGQLASDIWAKRMYPVIAPFIVLLLLCFLQHFSYDAVVKRNQKKQAKIDAENAPAEKILDSRGGKKNETN